MMSDGPTCVDKTGDLTPEQCVARARAAQRHTLRDASLLQGGAHYEVDQHGYRHIILTALQELEMTNKYPKSRLAIARAARVRADQAGADCVTELKTGSASINTLQSKLSLEEIARLKSELIAGDPFDIGLAKEKTGILACIVTTCADELRSFSEIQDPALSETQRPQVMSYIDELLYVIRMPEVRLPPIRSTGGNAMRDISMLSSLTQTEARLLPGVRLLLAGVVNRWNDVVQNFSGQCPVTAAGTLPTDQIVASALHLNRIKDGVTATLDNLQQFKTAKDIQKHFFGGLRNGWLHELFETTLIMRTYFAATDYAVDMCRMVEAAMTAIKEIISAGGAVCDDTVSLLQPAGQLRVDNIRPLSRLQALDPVRQKVLRRISLDHNFIITISALTVRLKEDGSLVVPARVVTVNPGEWTRIPTINR